MPSIRSTPEATPTRHLARRVQRYCTQYATPGELHETGVADLHVIHGVQRSKFEPSLYQPSVCLVLQGAKETSAGPRIGTASAGDLIVVSHHVPVTVRFTRATPEVPYLALVLDVDLAVLSELSGELDEMHAMDEHPVAMDVGPVDRDLLGAFDRLFRLVGDPQDERVVGPLVVREIHYRTLRSPQGCMLRELLHGSGHASQIAKATTYLRRHFRKALSVPDIAALAGMSTTTFHEHFKAVTSTTPLQYQKDLRLFEAQRLLRSGAHTVTDAAFDVGYESVSQFSREYSRKFGRTPREDRTT